MANLHRTRTPAGDPAWRVADYATIKALLGDPRLDYTHADPDRAPRYSDSVMFGRPQPESPATTTAHTRMRKLLSPWFSARRIEQLRPRVGEIAAHLLDELAGRDRPADFHDAVSFPLPALVICELLGVPYRDRDDFRRWSEETADMTDTTRSMQGFASLWQYISTLVATKLDQPGDDLLSALAAAHLADPATFTLVEAAQIGAAVLIAGHETTVAAIDSGVVLLAQHPEQRAALRADPSGIPAAVEEILRSARTGEPAPDDTTARGLVRWTNADVEVDGTVVPTGDMVVLDLRAANHAPHVVGDRPGFDAARRPNPHLTFGHGAHFCIGAPLARLELQVLFAALLERFSSLELAVAVEQLEPRSKLLTGGLRALPVTW
ncbi:cytochrome P450 [Pseudonocardia sp. TRM90224]|uniref:cytochrome P450 n=1 Tax=Pseudonocardia sp. TRM90224 TaxID=2812678 RepID=UPI001E2D70E0|nr:cytochrome P450 [Pseudonocardia sp. TRM90224]